MQMLKSPISMLSLDIMLRDNREPKGLRRGNAMRPFCACCVENNWEVARPKARRMIYGKML